jgi:GNAT superfamily N-acetyltransferase
VPRWTGEVAELDLLLTRWREWAWAAGAADAGPDSQASLLWPSRDVDAGRVFVAHGLAPGTTVAIRLRGRTVSRAPVPPGVTLRQARPADAGAVRGLSLEDIRYEGGLSVLGERPGHEDRRREETAAGLAGPDPWAWVAERDGAVVGAVTVARPADASWVGGLTSVRPAAYLGLLCVTAAERGTGIGAALVARAQDTVDRAGVAATLLHYGTFNPLSAPFWGRAGWRPLWTAWAAYPASTLR